MDVTSKAIQKARQMAKRNRTSVACARCKSAKIKCSIYRPCKQCVDANSCCTEANKVKSFPQNTAFSLDGSSEHRNQSLCNAEANQSAHISSRHSQNTGLDCSSLPDPYQDPVSSSACSSFNTPKMVIPVIPSTEVLSFHYPTTNFIGFTSSSIFGATNPSAASRLAPYQSSLPPALSALLHTSAYSRDSLTLPPLRIAMPSTASSLQLVSALLSPPHPLT